MVQKENWMFILVALQSTAKKDYLKVKRSSHLLSTPHFLSHMQDKIKLKVKQQEKNNIKVDVKNT